MTWLAGILLVLLILLVILTMVLGIWTFIDERKYRRERRAVLATQEAEFFKSLKGH